MIPKSGIQLSRYGAIDIGSNAVRLLIANVIESEEEVLFKKSSLIRVPVRLGVDAFLNKHISADNANRLIEAMKGFYHLMRANQVLNYKGCATSAMREAVNGPLIIERIRKESGIDIEIITGKKEAQIVYDTHMEAQYEDLDDFLYVDVGGGSTEITHFYKGVINKTRSFNIGTLRLLEKTVHESDWNIMKSWLSELDPVHEDRCIIGLGGNINKMFKMSMKETGTPLTVNYLKKQYESISAMSYEERIIELDLNPDRADVIVPALEIYINLMRWSEIKSLYVPKIGLSDGIVRIAYAEHTQIKKTKRKVFKGTQE